MAPDYSVFIGTFVHCKKLDKIEILHDQVVVVNAEGTITHVGPDDKSSSQYPGVGAGAQVTVYRCQDGQFFFPGFIGRWTTQNGTGSDELTHSRYTHSRIAIS